MENDCPQPRGQRPSVLIIDDDPGTLETFTRALAAHGLAVVTAGSGHDALEIARRRAFDLALIDLRLPDMLGTDLARTLHHELGTARFILISGFLTTRITVEAVRLGAVDVLEKPVALDDLLAAVDEILQDIGVTRMGDARRSAAANGRGGAEAPSRSRSSSAAERWAHHVLKACDSHSDIRTLDDWAACVGLSYTTLCESCRLLRIRPHDARDLARMLRAVTRSRSLSGLAMVLDVSDMRTLKGLLARAGLNGEPDDGPLLVEQFLQRQRFVSSDNEGLIVLKQLLSSHPVNL